MQVDILQIIQVTITVVTFIILLSNNYAITKIEHATNSMKDELVHEVRIASLAKGKLDEKTEAAKKTNT